MGGVNQAIHPIAPQALTMDHREDTDVAWARRQEAQRGVLKLFRVIVSGVRQHSELVARQCGISAAQLWLLWELAHVPGARVIDLARRLALHVGQVADMLEALEALRLTRRLDREGPAKRHRWAAAEAGRRLLDELRIPARGVLAHALEHLDGATLEALAACLQPLVGALPVRDEHAALKPLSELVGLTPTLSNRS